MIEGVRYVFGQRSMASLMVLMIFAGLFATPPVAFMIPAIVRDQLDAGAETLGLMMSAIGLGSVLGSVALLRLSRRPNKGEPSLASYFLTALAIAGVGVSQWVPLSLLLAVVGGFFGVIFIGLSTVVVQAMASDAMRARAMAVWAVGSPRGSAPAARCSWTGSRRSSAAPSSSPCDRRSLGSAAPCCPSRAWPRPTRCRSTRRSRRSPREGLRRSARRLEDEGRFRAELPRIRNAVVGR